jgi:hypothetical protein
MTQVFEKTRDTSSARAREIELIQTRLAVLSVVERTLETNYSALHGLRAAILQLSSRGGPRLSEIGRYRPSAVPSPIKIVYPGLTKPP